MLILIFILGCLTKEILHQAMLYTDVTWKQTDFICNSNVLCKKNVQLSPELLEVSFV